MDDDRKLMDKFFPCENGFGLGGKFTGVYIFTQGSNELTCNNSGLTWWRQWNGCAIAPHRSNK